MRNEIEYNRVVDNMMFESGYMKNLFVLTTTAIFVYQSQFAIRNYLDSPTIVIKSVTSWQNIVKPRNQEL